MEDHQSSSSKSDDQQSHGRLEIIMEQNLSKKYFDESKDPNHPHLPSSVAGSTSYLQESFSSVNTGEEQEFPAPGTSAAGGGIPLRQRRDRLRVSDYERLSDEEKERRRKDLSNKCSKNYNKRQMEKKKYLEEELKKQLHYNSTLRSQYQEKNKQVDVLKKALKKKSS